MQNSEKIKNKKNGERGRERHVVGWMKEFKCEASRFAGKNVFLSFALAPSLGCLIFSVSLSSLEKGSTDTGRSRIVLLTQPHISLACLARGVVTQGLPPTGGCCCSENFGIRCETAGWLAGARVLCPGQQSDSLPYLIDETQRQRLSPTPLDACLQLRGIIDIHCPLLPFRWSAIDELCGLTPLSRDDN
ncbi:hypothetical protein B9Z19DRAFT_133982 [Tuber borchii]|uniref:Uncharacterized protein n=1 Tax=Tuber borchii TaxID=42251 RepID=A0A2T6ZQS4_TUBBO|nr:hypothetical protein B9Z19DRAFT_133982 [Tuber borchii]